MHPNVSVGNRAIMYLAVSIETGNESGIPPIRVRSQRYIDLVYSLRQVAGLIPDLILISLCTPTVQIVVAPSRV
jgi:hypothetical protein